jgi:hypothetical protein
MLITLKVKETWEPTIEDLYKMDDERTTGPTIREIWGLDCQNHGEACTVNEDVLSRNEGLLSEFPYFCLNIRQFMDWDLSSDLGLRRSVCNAVQIGSARHSQS